MFLGNRRYSLPHIVYIDRKIVKHYNKRCGNRMRTSVVAYVRAVKKMAREHCCGEEKKSKWTQAHIRDMIDAIIDEFMNKVMDRSNRCRENYWSIDYDNM